TPRKRLKFDFLRGRQTMERSLAFFGISARGLDPRKRLKFDSLRVARLREVPLCSGFRHAAQTRVNASSSTPSGVASELGSFVNSHPPDNETQPFPPDHVQETSADISDVRSGSRLAESTKPKLSADNSFPRAG